MKIDLKKKLNENKKITKVVVNQFFGLGDILFIEPIYRYLHKDLGLEVIAPVQDGYIWIQDHIDYVSFKKQSEFKMDYERFDCGLLKVDNVIIDDTLYLPIRFSDQIFRDLKPHDSSAVRYWMTDKYRVINLDPGEWTKIKFKRNIKKEEELKKIIVGDVKEYDFCNLFYQNTMNINIGIEKFIQTDVPLIKMRTVDGFSMVDWSLIIEGARKIHTVSTSLLYMIQSIYQEGKDYHIYTRLPERGYISIEEFLPGYWIKHFPEEFGL